MKIQYFAPLVAALCVAAGCAADMNYNEYVSESRHGLYLYEDDGMSIKLCLTKKEAPFVADGICGKTGEMTEIIVKTPESCDEVSVTSQSFTGGDLSYLSARDSWYISFGGTLEGDEVKITLTRDGEPAEYTLQSVLTEGVMDCEGALGCVREHAAGLFEGLTENGTLNAEIFVRLLYDGKCYYYVGVCDREGNITAFLVDGQSGKIIAEREHRI